jgi:NAD(P)-dependent dehydrogenase (short-subunit alcohol dehydrogenase family)
MAGAVVIGLGPGIGMSVARRFGRGGMAVCAIARKRGAVDAAVAAVQKDGGEAMGLIADSTDPDEIAETCRQLHLEPKDAWTPLVSYTGRTGA